jgi:hypothetical protein
MLYYFRHQIIFVTAQAALLLKRGVVRRWSYRTTPQIPLQTEQLKIFYTIRKRAGRKRLVNKTMPESYRVH